MTKPASETTTTDSTESTETETETTAAPPAKKRTMARKKAPVYVPSAPLISPSQSYLVTVNKKGGGTYQQEYNWYSCSKFLFSKGLDAYKPSPPRAEVAIMVALYQSERGLSPGETNKEIEKMRDGGAMLVATIYAGLTGVAQEGMDEGVAKHLSELHADYKLAWAKFVASPEGQELMAGRRAKGKVGAVPDPKVSKYGHTGVGIGGAKAAGGQQALTQKEKREAILEATEKKKGGLLSRAIGES